MFRLLQAWGGCVLWVCMLIFVPPLCKDAVNQWRWWRFDAHFMCVRWIDSLYRLQLWPQRGVKTGSRHLFEIICQIEDNLLISLESMGDALLDCLYEAILCCCSLVALIHWSATRDGSQLIVAEFVPPCFEFNISRHTNNRFQKHGAS